MALILLAFGAIGHTVLWVALVNRTHALGIQRMWVNLLTIACVFSWSAIPFLIAAALLLTSAPHSTNAQLAVTASWSYTVFCAFLSVSSAFQRLAWWQRSRRNEAILSNHTSHVHMPVESDWLDVRGPLRILSRLPGNQVFKVRTQEKEIIVPRLPLELDGLRIAHLTDLHMSGRIAEKFYEHVVEETNAAGADLIALTGDIVEGDRFLDWIQPTLGRLRAPRGVYYVLGNHDRRATESKLKDALSAAGLIHVGSSCHTVAVRDSPVIVCGNELPWYKPAADLRLCPRRVAAGSPPRILLAHSPDQFKWAQQNAVDLMLAGHLHGGQIRFPLVGAITSPSRFGVRYSAGIFTEGNTVMHVSRGTGSLTPVRYGCPPEIAILVLRAKAM